MMLKYSTPIFQSATEESKTLSVVMTVFPPAPLSAATGMMSAAARQLKGTTSTAAEWNLKMFNKSSSSNKRF